VSGGTEEDDEDDAQDMAVGEQEQWSTDKPAGTPKKKRARIAVKSDQEESAIPGLVEKGASLMLSDDDIED
jgi:cell cycle checkpoint protein